MKKYIALLFLVAGLVLPGMVPNIAFGQQTSIVVLDEQATQTTYEIKATWMQSLKAAMDSSQSVSLTNRSAYAAVAGTFDVSEMLRLPTRAIPQVSVLASDYDEIALPLNVASDSVALALEGTPVYVSSPGTFRKAPVASLNFRLLTYDRGAGTLKRYRRLVVRVSHPQGNNVATGYNGTNTGFTAGRRDPIVFNAHLAVTESVLAEDGVIKFPVTRDGIYRIDRTFLSEAGLNPDTIDPDRIQIFGNGGAPVPELNGDERAADLLQNPVFSRGGGDGSFDDADVVLFYGAATTGWTFNAEDEAWEHYVNPFSVQNFYFLKVGAEEGVRVEAPAFPDYPDATVFSEVTGRLFVDFDDFNWSKQNGSGLTWVSSPIDPTGRLDIVTDSLPAGFTGGDVLYQGRVAIKSNPSAFARFSNGETQLGQVRTGTVRAGQEEPSARLAETTFTETVASGGRLNLSMTLEQQPNSPEVALDWMRAFYPQTLAAQNGIVRFATPAGASGRLEFVLAGFGAPPQVWDVTNPDEITRLGVSGSGNAFRVQLEVGTTPRELIAFAEQSAVTLDGSQITPVAAQNLHGLTDLPDFVIVTPAIFKPYADELAAMRTAGGLNVRVTLIEEIYNEFSGGLVDMRAVRDYLRFVYDKAPTDAQRLKYALFYGDGHFNFRNLGGDAIGLSNWIPPYATVDSFTPDRTYTSDDYFGLLDEEEGAWVYRGFGIPSVGGALTEPVDRMDIGVGRLTVQNEEEAQVLLEKIKHYENPVTYGAWRSRYTFISDDGPTGLSGTTDDKDLHLQNADVVAELVKGQFADVNVKKIYASSFDRIFRNGFKIPGAREEIINSLEEGTLLVNYSGHGGEEGLAQEGIFTAEDAKELDNYDRLAIFVTATCSFGWWDLANYQSGAEELLLNPNGGAVALLTTVRLVYTSSDINSLNVGLNRQLARDMFEADDEGRPRRLGDVLLLTKNTRVGLQGNNRKFNLLGDPTMRLGLPGRNVAVTEINDVAVDGEQAQVRALDKINIKGEVQTLNGTIDDSFNGVVDLTVFDAERRVPIDNQQHLATPYYTVRQDLIWRGQVQANSGAFNATFVVPKDISYSNQAGRLSVYAFGDNSHALGYNENFLVGGTSANPPNDNDGPQITLFLNDTTFVSGGLTSPEPKLIVKLFDESGINTVGAGVGHEMLLVVNEDEQNAIDISSGFRSETNSFQNGVVEWDLSQQQLGSNSLSLRAWDVLNNSSSATLDYFVAADEDLVLKNVYNYPNPTAGDTKFVFEHNQPIGTSASIQIRIYTLSGRLIRSIETDEPLIGGVIQLPWNGRDEDEDRLATGVYLYKLRVEVERQDGERQVSEKIEKLAIIR
ncbi:MAG: type IX secretion system sortase PorU [Bacteroidota bacterium]